MHDKDETLLQEAYQQIVEKEYTAQEVYDIQQKDHRGSSAEDVSEGKYVLKQVPLNEIPNRNTSRKQVMDQYDEGIGEYSDITIDDQMSRLSKDIDALPPIVLDKNNNVIDGGHRLASHAELGLETIKAFVQVETGKSFSKNI
tara:strand:+ start:4442 stop:4870 length:429 start_codon:yes stop_codon:yes gene_type:complete